MYAQMIKSTGKGVKSLDEMEPAERAFQERPGTGATSIVLLKRWG